MNWIRIKLWLANVWGFLALNPIFLYVLAGLILFLFIFGTIFQSCQSRGGLKLDKIEKQNKENEKRRKEELNNVFKDIDNRIANQDAGVNAAKSQDLSNRNTRDLKEEIERKAKEW